MRTRSKRWNKMMPRMQHLYFWYEIMMPLESERHYIEEYYWYGRYCSMAK